MGYRNTKYFQIIVKHRRAKNRILQIKTFDGGVSENPLIIEDTLFNHFKQSFEVTVNKDLNSILEELSSLPLPKLSSQQLDFFIDPSLMRKLNVLPSNWVPTNPLV